MGNKQCNLCPRECNIDRTKQLGFCKAPNGIKIARAALQFDEEPSISGSCGSGAIFFSCCTLKCIYCQNEKISQKNFGEEISIDRLVKIFFELQEKGAQNIHFITPTPYIPWIKEAIQRAKKKGFSLPFIYNTSGYEKIESLKQLDGLIDIYLPDFKYADDHTAQTFSLCTNYVAYTKQAIQEMFRQTGKNVFDDNGRMIKGVIVRHLILPQKEEESKKILAYLKEQYQNQIYISIMNQYTPIESVKNHPILKEKITDSVYQGIIHYALDIGITNAYIQEGDTADLCYVPSFQLEGVLEE